MQADADSSLQLQATPPSRIEWIDSLRVLFMFGVFLVHAYSLPGLGLYAKAATHGYLLLAGYLLARPGAYVPCFPAKKVIQLLIIYIFWCLMLRFSGSVITHAPSILAGTFDRDYSQFFPAWQDFARPYVAPYLCHLWWLKSFLLVSCLAGLLHRMASPLLLLLALASMGVQDGFGLSEPTFLRPSALGFYIFGVFLSRLPRTQIESLSGKGLPALLFLLILATTPLLLVPFLFQILEYPNLDKHCIFLAAYMLLLIICSHGIVRFFPRIQAYLSALAPSLMIFYLTHPLVIQVSKTANWWIFGDAPAAWAYLFVALLAFALSYGIYRFITAYSPLLCYLFLCKPKKKTASARD